METRLIKKPIINEGFVESLDTGDRFESLKRQSSYKFYLGYVKFSKNDLPT